MKELEPQSQPNGITKHDLDEQTAEVQKGVAESAQAVADHLDVRVEEVRASLIETATAVQTGLTEKFGQVESQLKVEMIVEKMVSDDARMKEVIDRRFRGHLRAFVVMFGLMFILSTMTYWLYANPRSGQSVFVLSDIRVTGPTDLCPGDSLKFEFDVTVKEVGVYSLFMSTWKTSPPPSTIIFSELQPFVIGSERSFPIIREWEIPYSYQDPADSKDTPMVPGEYIRDISVIAEGRDTKSTPLQVLFTIRDGCPGR